MDFGRPRALPLPDVIVCLGIYCLHSPRLRHPLTNPRPPPPQAMEIFELMEDQDKVIQVLINLANLAELQLDQPGQALEYR